MNLTRREFLKVSAEGAEALILSPWEFLRGIEQGQRRKNIELEPTEDTLPKGFKRFLIRVEGVQMPVASFITEENNSPARTALVTRHSLGDHFSFAGIEQEFNSGGRKIVAQFAGPFKKDGIQGIVYEQGRSVGESQADQRLKGLLLIKNGLPEIKHMSEIRDWQSFFAEVAREQYSLFQQFSVIHTQKVDSEVVRYLESDLASDKQKRRFFVRRDTPHESTFGVINFSEEYGVAESVAIMAGIKGDKTGDQRYGINEALYLDVGKDVKTDKGLKSGNSEGRLYDRSGKAYVLGYQNANWDNRVAQMVMYSQE